MNIERLFGIVNYILANQKATTSKLAELFEVSTRTINRDINKLSSVGIPVYTITGRNGGIYLLDNYILNKVLLTEEERQHLLLILKGTENIGFELHNNAYTKLQALFQSELNDWLDIDFSNWNQKKTSHDKFKLIKDFILNQQQIDILYANSYGSLKRRVCNPHKLIYKAQSWYMLAFCPQKENFRYFKLNRIISIYKTNHSFYKKTVPEIPILKSEKNNIDLCLKFSKEVYYRVYDEFEHNDIEKNSNHIVVNVNLPDDDKLIRYLLSFGQYLKIITPNSIKVKMKKEISTLKSYY